jgi:RNA polymerase sigma-70 factor (ECF subfamily)
MSTAKAPLAIAHDDPGEDDLLGRLSHLVRTRRASLAALARAEGVGPEDAVDCVQEGLCTLLARARSEAMPEDIEEWGALLAGIVRNAARNRRRRHFLARPHEDIDARAHAQADDLPATDDMISKAEEHVRLRLCVEELCEIQRAVVTLRMLEEQPGEDVARALGISAGHVAVLLHRAKTALRACMTAPA